MAAIGLLCIRAFAAAAAGALRARLSRCVPLEAPSTPSATAHVPCVGYACARVRYPHGEVHRVRRRTAAQSSLGTHTVVNRPLRIVHRPVICSIGGLRSRERDQDTFKCYYLIIKVDW